VTEACTRLPTLIAPRTVLQASNPASIPRSVWIAIVDNERLFIKSWAIRLLKLFRSGAPGCKLLVEDGNNHSVNRTKGQMMRKFTWATFFALALCFSASAQTWTEYGWWGG
jgi:hypothetical protein